MKEAGVETKPTVRELLERCLARMTLINGSEKACVMDPKDCPNHRLMREIEAFLTTP